MSSETEFLQQYGLSDYERPSVTADIVVFKISPRKTDRSRKAPENVLSLLLIKDSDSIAFDHAGIIAMAMTVLRNSAKDFEVIFDFLPEKVTLTELQNVQEAIMNISVLSANFRRKVASLVEETDEYTQGDTQSRLLVQKKIAVRSILSLYPIT